MAERRQFAKIPTRFVGYARVTSSLDDALRFTIAIPSNGPAASLEGAKLPIPVVKFLTGLDEKLDMLLSQQSLTMVEKDYPIKLDVREISGEGIRFLPHEEVENGTLLEVVMVLRQAPIRLAVAKGKAKHNPSDEAPSNYSMRFAAIRDNDLETLVSFSFEEEREHIRRRNKISG